MTEGRAAQEPAAETGTEQGGGVAIHCLSPRLSTCLLSRPCSGCLRFSGVWGKAPEKWEELLPVFVPPSCNPRPPAVPCFQGAQALTCLRGSVLCSAAWAVAWRAPTASVATRSLDATVSSRTRALEARSPAWDFRGCGEMVAQAGTGDQILPRCQPCTKVSCP